MNPVGFVALEETDSCILRSIDKIVETTDAYYVLDKPSQILAKFDKDGKYNCTIGRQGSGPGEYLRINDFDISEDSQTIYISSQNSEILTYSSIDGSLIDITKINTAIPLSEIAILRNGIFMTADDVPADIERLYSLDKHLDIVGAYQYRGDGLTSTLCRQLRRDNDSLYFMDWVNNTLFRYDEKTQQPQELVSFYLSKDIKSEGINDFMWFMSQQHELGFIRDWCIMDAFLVMYSACDGKMNILVLDTDNMKIVYIGKYSGLVPDLNASINNKTFISSITLDNYEYFKDNLPSAIVIPPFETGKTNAILMSWRIKEPHK